MNLTKNQLKLIGILLVAIVVVWALAKSCAKTKETGAPSTLQLPPSQTTELPKLVQNEVYKQTSQVNWDENPNLWPTFHTEEPDDKKDSKSPALQ